MKLYLITFLLLALDPIGKLDRVAKQNALKKEAREAFVKEDYKTAIEKYSFLHDSLNVRDDNILLNLANAQFKVADSSNALGNYQKLTSSADKSLRSIAYQQLGVMNNDPQNQQKALDYFKKALKADPSNEEARYNYELLKKLMKEQENQENKDDKNKDEQDKKDQEKQDQEKDQKDKQEKDQQEKDQDKGDKQDQEQKDQQQKEQQQNDKDQEQTQDQQDADQKKDKEQKEGQQQEQQQDDDQKDKKDKIPPSTQKKLQEMKISPEKAKMILEAMKNQEVQYIQQNRKKARNRGKNDKPDW